MIYTLFIWTVVATQAVTTSSYQRSVHDWRALATVETNVIGIEKCDDVARQLNIPKDRYRCIRTK
jgi:hypothetical protein